jgi:hypothetical protein
MVQVKVLIREIAPRAARAVDPTLGCYGATFLSNISGVAYFLSNSRATRITEELGDAQAMFVEMKQSAS